MQYSVHKVLSVVVCLSLSIPAVSSFVVLPCSKQIKNSLLPRCKTNLYGSSFCPFRGDNIQLEKVNIRTAIKSARLSLEFSNKWFCQLRYFQGKDMKAIRLISDITERICEAQYVLKNDEFS